MSLLGLAVASMFLSRWMSCKFAPRRAVELLLSALITVHLLTFRALLSIYLSLSLSPSLSPRSSPRSNYHEKPTGQEEVVQSTLTSATHASEKS